MTALARASIRDPKLSFVAYKTIQPLHFYAESIAASMGITIICQHSQDFKGQVNVSLAPSLRFGSEV
ncbi:predicted protein [Coccidioides posadasii str. Silveira]|uniref:Predicted protein n=1 Tax=Coccidioides posadasii (strain RMSCC 757 / Silveira) TaxID=443226 RepID=E9D2E4_COCPS|nr:predicted protein [Coccidioides posadasii str. Silveira]